MTHRALAPGSRLTLEAIPGISPEIALPAFIPDTNVIEQLHEEFRRRVKTQGSLPTEDAALVLLFRLIVSGRSACTGSMAGSRSLLCSARAARWRHHASRIGARIAFGGPTLSRYLSESALSAGRASSYARFPRSQQGGV
jgi:hypothetical protein